jgi:hypothetical protein
MFTGLLPVLPISTVPGNPPCKRIFRFQITPENKGFREAVMFLDIMTYSFASTDWDETTQPVPPVDRAEIISVNTDKILLIKQASYYYNSRTHYTTDYYILQMGDTLYYMIDRSTMEKIKNTDGNMFR